MTDSDNSRIEARRPDSPVNAEVYRTLAEAAEDYIFVIGRDGIIEYVNSFAAARFGRRSEELIGRARSELFGGETSERQAANLARVFETGESLMAEDRSEFPSGVVWLETRLVPLCDQSGSVRSALGVSRDVTRRKLMEEALRHSEEKFRNLSEEITEGVAVIIDGRNRWVNKAFARIFGYEPEEMIDRRAHFVAPPEEVPKLEDRMKRRLAGEPVISRYETAGVRKDGTRISVEVSARKIVFEDRDAVQIVIRDISEQKSARKALEFQAMLLDQIQDRVTATDLDGVITYVNKTAAEFLGLDKSELIGRPVLVFGEDPSRGATQKQIVEETQARGEWRGEVVNYSSRGEESIADCRTWTLRDENGTPTGLCGSASDITARKAAERALRESEELYRSLVETSPDAVFLLDLEGRYIFVNKRAVELHGRDGPEEMLGQSAFDNITPEHRERAARIRELMLEQGGARAVEHTLCRKDGSRFESELNAAVVRDHSGRPKAFLGVARDVTERKRVEREIMAKNQELEALNQQLKAAEQELQQRNNELEAAIKARSDFLSMISHELRTPMTPIIGYADLILKQKYGPLPEPVVRPLETIRRRAGNLQKLIEDLLSLSRAERGTLAIDIQPVMLGRHIAEIRADYLEMKLDKPVKIEVLGADIAVMADHDRLHEVLSNLIDNAVKYSVAEAEIRIETLVEPGWAVIRVSDRGVGIPDHALDKVFERFYQVEVVETRAHGGSGLGLAIARELLELMQGTITVESRPGYGSTFTVKLPRAPAEPA